MRALYVEEGADRSGGHCIKRARTSEEGDVQSGERRQVRRALYKEEGADR